MIRVEIAVGDIEPVHTVHRVQHPPPSPGVRKFYLLLSYRYPLHDQDVLISVPPHCIALRRPRVVDSSPLEKDLALHLWSNGFIGMSIVSLPGAKVAQSPSECW